MNYVLMCERATRPFKKNDTRHHTMDKLINDVNGATVFSKLDLRSGYRQLELNSASRYITTFSTRMRFPTQGLKLWHLISFRDFSRDNSQYYSRRKSKQGAKNTSDDIVVFGKTKAEPDSALQATFQIFEEKGLTLNKKKCELHKSKIVYFGLVFSGGGMSPDPTKVEAIREAEKRSSK